LSLWLKEAKLVATTSNNNQVVLCGGVFELGGWILATLIEAVRQPVVHTVHDLAAVFLLRRGVKQQGRPSSIGFGGLILGTL